MRAAQIAAADKCLRWQRVLVILNVLVLSIGYYFNIIKNVMWKKGEKKKKIEVEILKMEKSSIPHCSVFIYSSYRSIFRYMWGSMDKIFFITA